MKSSMRWHWATSRIWKVFRWVLFQFDAENAHRMTVRLIRLGWRMGPRPLIFLSGSSDLVKTQDSYPFPKVMGIEFLSRVGLAAGFDKDCEILPALPFLGFGYAEIGTVTPLPQSGNPRPRLFRDMTHQSVLNRMGFNGSGAQVVSRRLEKVKPHLPAKFRVGVNIGKNKLTSPENTHRDYRLALEPFEGLADYVVMNVSSPNTPGLRALQSVEALKPILDECVNLTSKWQSAPPLLLKLAPELNSDELMTLIHSLEGRGVQGWVLTNTLAGTFKWRNEELPGGWSGKVLAAASRKSLETVRRVTTQTVISVGGIGSEAEALSRMQLGADLIQVYTGWIYGGPAFPAGISRMLKKSGF